MTEAPRLLCGLKLTHDGGLALVEVDGDRTSLVGAIEREKVGEAPRHAPLTDLDLIVPFLADLGCRPDDVDEFVVDGWGVDAVRDGLPVRVSGSDARVRTAPYRTSDDTTPLLHRYRPQGDLFVDGRVRPYVSHRHITGHLAAGYLASPAAQQGRAAFVLAWDGGIGPELFHIDPAARRVQPLGCILGISGGLYSGFASTVDPFRPDPSWSHARVEDHHLSIPGKAMAYAGLGQADGDVVDLMSRLLAAAESEADPVAAFTAGVWSSSLAAASDGASLLAAFECSVAALVVERLRGAIARSARTADDLVLTGGCALNIKWNSAIRRGVGIERVWVPPFPNDSGAALGAAAASAMASGAFGPLAWSVYQGPALDDTAPGDGWRSQACSPRQLGYLLADLDEPVVVLSGRAEIGPRALGHRSILASPARPAMRDRLNAAKRRESYRPVAPLCLAERAADVFTPGGDDRHMAFDHRVRPDWASRIPAVVHVDGTARLQTLSVEDEPVIHEVLSAFADRSGIPVLCNTSANRPGRGFFPGVRAAADWGEVDHIWSDGTLHVREGSSGIGRES
jgi:carbamoyltransferase